MPTIRTVCAHDCPDMCSILAHVENGRVVKIEGDPEHPFTAGFACGKVNRDADLAYSPERLTTPLRRTGRKGEGKFTPITWDAALDEIVSTWKRVMAESGPLALLGYAYSAHQGQINRGLTNGLFHALGCSRLRGGTVCDSCSDAAWVATLGDVGGADPESVQASDLMVSWSSDLHATNVHLWAAIEKRRAAGVKLVVIDPRRTRAARVADLWLPVRIGTDSALALGVMNILARDGKVDRAYLASQTLGFDRVEREILPRFTPEATAAITGLSVADIETFAAWYGAAKKSFIRIGFGLSRSTDGGQNLRSVALLPGVTGAYGRYGGGALLATVAGFEFNYNALRKPSGPAEARTINHLKLGEALRGLNDPPIRALFIAANNPAVTNPNTAVIRAGLAREDLFTVVHDPFMTETAKFADIVLPATTYLETDDFYRAYGTYYMQYGQRVIEPCGEAWSNHRLTQTLAARLGVTDRVFQMSPPELVGELFRGATGALTRFDPAGLLDGKAVSIGGRGGQVFATPSGKLEFYSGTLAKQGLPPMPDWRPDPEDTGDGRLRLLTTPGYFQSHTAFSANAFLREREGQPHAVLHPDDAAARGLSEGQRVRLRNERGEVGLILHVRDEIQPGIVLVPGQRPDDETVGGTVNMLCADGFTDMGEGATYQSTWLDVSAW
ncbi:MAG: molybdopterin oxidoreductase family protein [Acetobacteraceae bacterium]|nr:molybdopterin oxidoreductase family protein [Acetobacteraceae bacterium]